MRGQLAIMAQDGWYWSLLLLSVYHCAMGQNQFWSPIWITCLYGRLRRPIFLSFGYGEYFACEPLRGQLAIMAQDGWYWSLLLLSVYHCTVQWGPIHFEFVLNSFTRKFFDLPMNKTTPMWHDRLSHKCQMTVMAVWQLSEDHLMTFWWDSSIRLPLWNGVKSILKSNLNYWSHTISREIFWSFKLR